MLDFRVSVARAPNSEENYQIRINPSAIGGSTKPEFALIRVDPSRGQCEMRQCRATPRDAGFVESKVEGEAGR